MSDYGVFEASSTDGHEEEQRQRQAKRDLGTAIEAAREGFGDFLGSSTDKQDYQDRLALVMNDLMQKVADSGVMPVPGVMRKVKAALRPEFRKSTGARAVPYLEAYPDSTATGDEWTIVDESGNPLVKDQGDGGGDVPYHFRSEDAAEEAAQRLSRSRTAAPQTISDADKAKVIPAGSTEIPQSDVASALEAGERVYGLSPSGSEILAIRSADTDAQFYWVAGSGSMWDVSANRRAAGWRDEVGQAVDEYLDATSTPRIAPHPEYGEGVWSDEGVKQRVLSLNPNLPTPELVDAIMREMGDFYDSIDRELAFWYFSQVTGKDYDDFYNAWLNIPSGKYFSRKQAAPGFDPNISDENLLAGLQIAEALNHDGSNQAKVDELRAEVDARGLTPLKTSRKQAGSAQVLQKLENALNDQRSVDVICSNSPDGSFSSEREIPVDEGLQKVRGWVSAGDLVDTAQGGNFFDFEHRASGENVNFYITQEY